VALVTGLRFATIAYVGVLEIFYKIILLQVDSLAWATVRRSPANMRTMLEENLGT
jgi:hypothetical protein